MDFKFIKIICIFLHFIACSLLAQSNQKHLFLINSKAQDVFILSGSSGHVIWESGDLSKVNLQFKNLLHLRIAQAQRAELIYSQVEADSWQVSIFLNAEKSKTDFYLVSELKNGNIAYQRKLNNGKNKIDLRYLKLIKNLKIIAKSEGIDKVRVSYHVKDLVLRGNIPLKLPGVDKSESSKVILLDAPPILSTNYCGIPTQFFKKKIWHEILEHLDLGTDYCHFIKNLQLIRNQDELVELIEYPDEPQKPVYIGDYDEYVSKHYLSKPQKRVIEKNDLKKIITEEYSKDSFIDMTNAYTTNSAYLIDLSNSVQGIPLNTIKRELLIQLNILNNPNSISVYVMVPHWRLDYSRIFENFQGKALMPEEFVRNYQIVENLRHRKSGIYLPHDKVIHAFTFALDNKELDTINILSDTEFDEFRNGQGEWLIAELRSKIREANRPITINIYSFNQKELEDEWEDFCEEIVQLGTGMGKYHSGKNLNPNLTKKVLKRIESLDDPEVVVKLVEGYQKLEDQKYETELSEWQIKKNKLVEARAEYMAKYNHYLNLLEEWKSLHKIWRKQVKEILRTEKKYSQKGIDPKVINESRLQLKQKINDGIELAKTDQEREFYQSLKQYIYP